MKKKQTDETPGSLMAAMLMKRAENKPVTNQDVKKLEDQTRKFFESNGCHISHINMGGFESDK